jgi:hypothetical protein
MPRQASVTSRTGWGRRHLKQIRQRHDDARRDE